MTLEERLTDEAVLRLRAWASAYVIGGVERRNDALNHLASLLAWFAVRDQLFRKQGQVPHEEVSVSP